MFSQSNKTGVEINTKVGDVTMVNKIWVGSSSTLSKGHLGLFLKNLNQTGSRNKNRKAKQNQCFTCPKNLE